MLVQQRFLVKSLGDAKVLLSSLQSKRWQSTVSQPQSAAPQSRLDKDVKQSGSFVMNMFLGKPVLHQVFPYPYVLTEDEKETLTMLYEPNKRFFEEMNDASRNDLEENLDSKVMNQLKELGAFGMQVPTEYGGVGLRNSQYAKFAELIGQHDLGLGITLGAHQSIGFKGILIAGSEELKKKYLPVLATGEKIAAFALTEPTSGSDAGSIRTRAVLSEDGSHYILTGSKVWISNGGIADVYTVFAQTSAPNKSGGTSDKVTGFIVERSFGGVTSGPPEKKMGIKASNTAEVFFENVKVPAENVVGEVGGGFKLAMEILNCGRFGMCACLAGTMKVSMNKAVEFASNRVQFGRKIDTFGTIQEKIARMAMKHYVAESVGFMVAANMDSGIKDYQLEAAVGKIFASEGAWQVVDEALQVLGGMGYMRETGIERIMRDVRIFRIFEGTNEILRLLIALTGIQYAGGHLKELLKAFKSPTSNFGLIFDEGTKRARKVIGMSQSTSIEGLHPALMGSGTQLIKNIEIFGDSTEQLLRKFGKKIVDEQFILQRLADAAIDLYTTSVVLSRASRAYNNNYTTAEHEMKLARVWATEAFGRVQNNLTATKAASSINVYNDLADISRDVCENGEPVVTHPLGL